MEGWLPTSQDESGVKPSLHLMAFPACSAQPRGRHVGLGAGASLGSGSTFASNFLCGLQIPSPVWVSEMETPLSIAVTKVYKTTNVKVAYNCFAPVKTITVATLLLSCPQQHPSLNCSPFANQLLSEPEAQNSPSPEVSSLQVRVPSPHQFPKQVSWVPGILWSPEHPLRVVHRDITLHPSSCTPLPNLPAFGCTVEVPHYVRMPGGPKICMAPEPSPWVIPLNALECHMLGMFGYLCVHVLSGCICICVCVCT